MWAMRSWGLWACAALLLPLASARADIPDEKIKIGIIDTSGPETMRTARGAMVAAQMACEDFEARSFKLDTELHEFDSNAPGKAPRTVHDWLDKDHIDVVIDVAGTDDGTAAIAHEMQARDRLFVLADLGGPDLAKAVAAPTTLIWGVDPVALSHSVVYVLAGQGLRKWFFVVGHGPLQQALAADAARLLAGAGGQVLGMYTHPLGMRDFQPDMGKATSSGAEVVALSEVGPELDDAVKEAAWLGLPERQQLAMLFAPLQVIQQIGLQAAQGAVVAAPFYWNRNKASRDFTQRYARMDRGRMPTATEAIVYSATTAVLQAAAAVHSIDASRVVAELRRKPIPDDMLGTITVRPDGVAQHDVYVFRVKRPAESRQLWDDYKEIAVVPGAIAFAPAPAAKLPNENELPAAQAARVSQEAQIPPTQAPTGAAPEAHEAPRQIPQAPAATPP